MKEYKIYTTKRFEKEKSKLTLDEQRKIDKIFLQLKSNPYVGDQLRYKFFREKRIKEKRIYYLVYDDFLAVLIVAISNKKTQKETIDYIMSFFDEYRRYVGELVMEDKD